MKRKTFDKNPKNITRRNQFVFRRWLNSLGLGIICAVLSAIPVGAAEQVYLIYGPLKLSIGVDSLETFASEGTINKELAFYLGRLSEEDQAKFRQRLVEPFDINFIQLYRFFHTPMGEQVLTSLGKLVNIPGGRNGFYGLRGALVQAAAEPEGLTLIDAIRKFPTNIQLDIEGIFLVAERIELVKKATEEMVASMRELAAAEAAAQAPVNFSALPDIRQPGEFGVDKQTITLKDKSRSRQFLVDLYRPQRWRPGKAPVAIISHGWASSPQEFENYARHLTSYGYVVAVPQHPGSDFTQLQEMFQGYSSESFRLNEFIDRPRDVSYVLDELERRNQSQFQGRLNLQEVGVAGHSFGGYTALAVAGAEIDFERLEKECGPIPDYPNLSLLLQCRALELPRQTYNFRDNRVKAVFAVDPVDSAVFGPKGLSKIQIPVLIGAGSEDTIAPAVLEQVQVFPWLRTPNKHLGVVKGKRHVDDFSRLDSGSSAMLQSISDLSVPEPILLYQYGYAMTLAYFEVYIANNAEYRPYLQSSYTEFISEDPFYLYLIGSSSVDELDQKIRDFRTREGLPEP